MAPGSTEQEVIPESFQDIEELQREQQWANILSEVFAEPISNTLKAYCSELRERSPSWTMDALVKGVGSRYQALVSSYLVQGASRWSLDFNIPE